MPCAMIFNLLGFMTTVSLTANTQCVTDGLTLACLVPYAPEPGLVTRAHRAITGLPDHAVVHHISKHMPL